MKRYDAIVIGGGPGGLSAALYLSLKGRKVLLLEKNEKVGGNCTAGRFGEYVFDLAVHQLSGISGNGACAGIMDEYGLSSMLKFKKIDPFLVISMPDGFYRICGNREDFFETFAGYFPREAGNLKKIMKRLDALRINGYIAQNLLYGFNRKTANLAMREMGFGSALARPFDAFFNMLLKTGFSASELAGRWTDNLKLLSLLHSSWVYLGLPPSRLSGVMMHIFLSMQYSSGAYYPEGGSQKLADAMELKIRGAGGEIVTSAPVTGIISEDGRVKGVEFCGGERAFSEIVISNADMFHTYEKLLGPGNLPAGFMENLKSKKVSMGPFRVCLGLDYDVKENGLKDYEYMLFPGYDHDALYEDMRRGTVNGISVYSPSGVSPGLAPRGCSTLILTTMIGWKPEKDWRGRENEIAGGMISIAEKRLLPGLSGHVKVMEILTPGKLNRITNSRMGAMYGWENSPEQTLLKRPSMRSPIDGLYHVGHWTRPGTGVTSAIISGWILGKALTSPLSALRKMVI